MEQNNEPHTANSQKITERFTLDEAIEHCREVKCNNIECKLDHLQLAQWLIELKELRALRNKFLNLPYLK